MKSFTLDLQVPTYIAAGDLTQRIARDAGLDSHWDDGRRRLYWLRARGRVLNESEKLQDLGVVPGELVYLLPEPPQGSSVLEQPPDYPETHGYPGKGIPSLAFSLIAVSIFSIGWGFALSVERTLPVVLLPGLGLGFLTVSLARQAWGGRASNIRVVATGLLLFIFIAALAFTAPALLSEVHLGTIYSQSVGGLIVGIAGVLLGWVAWWGAVEPLQKSSEAQAAKEQVAQTYVCSICGLPVSHEVKKVCPHNCGRVFHVGCYDAQMAVYRGDPNVCGICKQKVR